MTTTHLIHNQNNILSLNSISGEDRLKQFLPLGQTCNKVSTGTFLPTNAILESCKKTHPHCPKNPQMLQFE
jgi:hypothetical protein